MSVRHALLSLLSEGPKFGLQLREEFEARTGDVWPLNVGQVYTTLQRLERGGLIASEGEEHEGSHKSYRITPAGFEELTAWLHSPSGVSPPPRDELVIKVMVALSVPGVDVNEVVQVHRRHLVETMQRYTQLKRDAPEDDLGLAVVVDAELLRLNGLVRWLEITEERLGRVAGKAPGKPASGLVPSPAPAVEKSR